ncbi:unnamed protein product [Closterium sp. Yama58-4]|nr:unnamed protein product [Closterium sp. Yama58-4]
MAGSSRRTAFTAMAACLLLLTASSAAPRAAAFHVARDARDGDGRISSVLESSYDRDAALERESTYEEDDDVARAAGFATTRGAGRDPAALIATSAGFAYPMAAPIYVAKSQLPTLMSLKATWSKWADLSSWDGSKPCDQWTRIKCWTDGTISLRLQLAPSACPFSLPLQLAPSGCPCVFVLASACLSAVTCDLPLAPRPSPRAPRPAPLAPRPTLRAPRSTPLAPRPSLRAPNRRMEMSGMGLRGSLPGIIGDLTTLEELLVTKNWFTHEFPNYLSKLVRLKNLQVWSNYFNHTIPPGLGNLRSLYQLHLNINYFKGGIPNTFSQLTNLYRLFVSSNLLSGTFPSVICTMTTLRELRISGNHFEGSIPPCVSRLKLLYYMYVDTNRFTGRLPKSIGTMTNLQNLFINQNSIAGPLPATITRLRNLRILFMSSNPKLTGRLPRNLGNMVGLTDLVMEFCNFSGPIPPSITRLTRLQRLLLDNNYFRGIVPENLSRLTDITILYLERNFLYGTFPKGISQLPKLAYLNLHSNLLTGPLPTNFPSTRFIDYGQYNLRNNFFNGPAVVTAGGRSFCPVNHTYTGVFFESSLAKNCLTYPAGSPCVKAGLVQVQVPTNVCKRFCNADTNTCGGKGYCWFGGGRDPSCDCFRGYKPTADKQLCVKA